MIVLMDTIFSNVNANAIIEFVFLILILTGLNLFVNYFIKRKFVWIPLLVFSLLCLISYIFKLEYLFLALCILILLLLFISFMANLAEFRSFFANKSTQKKNDKIINLAGKKKENYVQKIFDHSSLYEKINDCVQYCSKNKIGALITIERNDDLSKIIANGTVVDAPVSAELLETIFYPGSRLHDGAAVIKDDTIVAASVYYTPTTKALAGKYGSRHRAALGISEICDAVTVVVSEETGKISIAFNGELNSFTPDNFLRGLINTMSFEDSQNKK